MDRDREGGREEEKERGKVRESEVKIEGTERDADGFVAVDWSLQ